MNLLISRLDEQQRRWYAGVHRLGHGGDEQIFRITTADHPAGPPRVSYRPQ